MESDVIPTVAEIESWLGAPLPVTYFQFLDSHSHDLAVSDLVLLYGRSTFVERNETYETQRYCPGFVTIGNDSGDREIMLCLQDESASIVDAGAMNPQYFTLVDKDCAAWIANGCPLPDDEESLYPATENVHVYLERKPKSLKTLLLIKQHLGLDTSTGVLKDLLESAPCSLTDRLTYAQAIGRCAEVNHVDKCLGIRSRIDQSHSLPLEWTD